VLQKLSGGGVSSFKIERLDATFGAVVTDVSLREISDEDFDDLYKLWLEHALLIFPGQHLARQEQENFALRFGELEFPIGAISNLRSDGTVRGDDLTDDVVKVLKGNMSWHCDSTYMPVQAKGAIFSAEVVPPAGGETGWADMRAAYALLDEPTKKKIANLKALHSLYYSQGKLGHRARDDSDYSGYGFHAQDPPLRPLIKIHPETAVPALMIGRHAYGIPGMTEWESEQFLAELADFACQPPRIYHHRWSPGDVVAWDNRSLMHRACPWDMSQPRVMVNCRLKGDPKSEFAPPAGSESVSRQIAP
jgi:alpha-ketoglutarate-dependent taurine dioxygenase